MGNQNIVKFLRNNIFQLTTYVIMIIIHNISLLVYIYLLILCNNYSKILYLIDLRNFHKVFDKSRKRQACKIQNPRYRNSWFVFPDIETVGLYFIYLLILQTFLVELVVYSSAYPILLEMSLM